MLTTSEHDADKRVAYTSPMLYYSRKTNERQACLGVLPLYEWGWLGRLGAKIG
jgi:hypothetical protein